jgi:hypothetical protein
MLLALAGDYFFPGTLPRNLRLTARVAIGNNYISQYAQANYIGNWANIKKLGLLEIDLVSLLSPF